MKENWIVKKRRTPDIIRHILILRGIEGERAQASFLEPNFSRDLHDPFLMRGMGEVIKRIKTAIKGKERIGIFGDYDADGVCGSVILASVFKRLELEALVETYLPDRQKEGFGLNIAGLSYFSKKKVTLVLTTDCGITNHKEIGWAKRKGIDVIVTDHHQLVKGPPPAMAFLDPKRPDETYPFHDLAGTGVAFKLAQGLKRELKTKALSEAWEKRLLDLVAIATVADMMPLLDENRVFVKYGLLVIHQTHREGLRALIEEAGLERSLITIQDLAFSIGPRINATSRIDHAVKALKLLLTSDKNEAKELARDIEVLNKRRRTLVDKILKAVRERVGKKSTLIEKKKIVFEGDRSWQPGLLSLVSNRIKDDYVYPTVILSLGKKLSIASCRAHPPFSLVKAMEVIHHKYPSLFLRWGGHHQAAGFTVKTKDLEKVKSLFERQTKSFSSASIKQKLEVDCELEAGEIRLNLWEEIQKLEPFGKGNPEPLFLLRELNIFSVKKVGNHQDHFRLVLEKDDKVFDAFFLNGGKNHELKAGDVIDVVFNLHVSGWNLNTTVELRIVDLTKS